VERSLAVIIIKVRRVQLGQNVGVPFRNNIRPNVVPSIYVIREYSPPCQRCPGDVREAPRTRTSRYTVRYAKRDDAVEDERRFVRRLRARALRRKPNERERSIS